MGKSLKERATVICRLDDKILFVRKSKSKWNLPGGRIEADERPGQAALRELIEETGLALEQMNYIAPLELYQTLHYVFETPVDPAQQPTPLNEIADCRWFTAEEASKRNINKSARRVLKNCMRQAG